MSTQANAQSDPKGDYAAVNDMKMYYEVSGEGDPLIILHGAYMNIPAMGGIVGKLAETHTVYALEFQGHGRTEDIDRPVTYPNLADDVAAFMDVVGLQKADVFGYSMGAGAALQLAIRHPEKVDHLIAASVSYDVAGAQPEFLEMVPTMSPEMFVGSPMEDAWKEYAPNPDGFRPFVERMIALEHEPQAWGGRKAAEGARSDHRRRCRHDDARASGKHVPASGRGHGRGHGESAQRLQARNLASQLTYRCCQPGGPSASADRAIPSGGNTKRHVLSVLTGCPEVWTKTAGLLAISSNRQFTTHKGPCRQLATKIEARFLRTR